jgi:hypothetical protein
LPKLKTRQGEIIRRRRGEEKTRKRRRGEKGIEEKGIEAVKRSEGNRREEK